MNAGFHGDEFKSRLKENIMHVFYSKRSRVICKLYVAITNLIGFFTGLDFRLFKMLKSSVKFFGELTKLIYIYGMESLRWEISNIERERVINNYKIF